MQNSVLDMMDSGMTVITQKKNLDFIKDNSMNIFLQYLQKQQVSIQIN